MVYLSFPIKFIHAADIHLGSMLNVSNEAITKEFNIFKNGVYKAFEKIIDYAITYNVNFLLISGDLYDKDCISIRANNFFINQCDRLLKENIKVFVISGNHDPFINKKELFKIPPNVFICESESVSEFEVRNEKLDLIARICGESYRGKADSRKMYSQYNPPKDGIFNIGMLHTELNSKSLNYVPCTLDNLKSNEKIDYWALGHIHKANVINREKPAVAFSGVAQGRDIGEIGVKGCILVSVNEDGNTDLEFLPTSNVVWNKIEVDINENLESCPENLTELIRLIEDKAKSFIQLKPEIQSGLKFEEESVGIIKGYAIRWVITGRGKLKSIFDESTDDIEEIIIDELNSSLMKISPFVYTDSIDIRLENSLEDYEELLSSNGTLKRLYELIEKIDEDCELKKNLIKNLGQVWEEDFDRENINNFKLPLEDEDFNMILNRAKQLIVMKFIKENN